MQSFQQYLIKRVLGKLKLRVQNKQELHNKKI